MNSFNEAPRDDLNMMEFMIQNDWKPCFSTSDMRYDRTTPQNCPSDPVGYEKDNIKLWKSYKYVPNEKYPHINDVVGYWIRAELVDHHYVNHKQADNLKDLIESHV